MVSFLHDLNKTQLVDKTYSSTQSPSKLTDFFHRRMVEYNHTVLLKEFQSSGFSQILPLLKKPEWISPLRYNKLLFQWSKQMKSERARSWLCGGWDKPLNHIDVAIPLSPSMSSLMRSAVFCCFGWVKGNVPTAEYMPNVKYLARIKAMF